MSGVQSNIVCSAGHGEVCGACGASDTTAGEYTIGALAPARTVTAEQLWAGGCGWVPEGLAKTLQLGERQFACAHVGTGGRLGLSRDTTTPSCIMGPLRTKQPDP